MGRRLGGAAERAAAPGASRRVFAPSPPALPPISFAERLDRRGGKQLSCAAVLLALRVRNFILMDALELRLSPGFNVLTGETGAGKSIVVGALSLVLGGRASAEHVRPGESEAEVEALFDVSDAEGVRARLEASDVLARDGELVLRRVVQSNGRSRAYMNGKLCTAAELAAIAPELCDIASQHESVALSNPGTHLSNT